MSEMTTSCRRSWRLRGRRRRHASFVRWLPIAFLSAAVRTVLASSVDVPIVDVRVGFPRPLSVRGGDGRAITSASNRTADATGDDWPSLYDELNEMNRAAQMAYFISDLRKVAAAGNLTKGGAALLGRADAPARLRERAAAKIRERLALARHRRDPRTVMRHGLATGEILKIVRRERDALGLDPDDPALSALQRIDDVEKDIMLEEFDDHLEDRRLVFCVARNPCRKRITLMVRGSLAEGTSDFYRNWQFGHAALATPARLVARMRRRPSALRVHRGFYEYLFHNDDLRATRDDAALPQQRIEEIADNVIAPLLRANPGYRLYVTGHSLGGALATLVAFHFAAAPEVRAPVTLVTFASPYVGGRDFREAFKLLEGDGRLRCLRVTNHQDGIPTLFPFSPSLRPYKHVGVHLTLFSKRNKVRISYPRNGHRGFFREVANGWRNSFLYNLNRTPFTMHSTDEYSRRIELQKEVLSDIKLNDLYRDEDLVGNLDCKL